MEKLLEQILEEKYKKEHQRGIKRRDLYCLIDFDKRENARC